MGRLRRLGHRTVITLASALIISGLMIISTHRRDTVTIPRRASSGVAALKDAKDALRRAVTFGEPTAYVQAERQLALARKSLGDTVETEQVAINLALTRHQFRSAESRATSALKRFPNDLLTQLLAVDSAVELGHYAEADRRLSALENLRPTAGTYARRSYLLQLYGDSVAAELAMRQALAASSAPTAERAVLLSLLGDLQLENGRVGGAEHSYIDAQQIEPRLVIATVGRAKVAIANHDFADARELLDRVVDQAPTPTVLTLLADTARATKSDSAEPDALLDGSVALFRANGAVIDAELAIELVERPSAGDRKRAVELARHAYADRQTLFTADALSWTLYRSGSLADAAEYARRAVATDPSIGAIQGRAALVLDAAGDRAAARHAATRALQSRAFPSALSNEETRLRHIAASIQESK